MRVSILLSTASTLTLVLAHPLFIFSLPSHHVYRPGGGMLERRQGIFDPIESAIDSAFGITATDDSSPSTTESSPSKTTANSIQVGEPVTGASKSSTITSPASTSRPTTTSSHTTSTSTDSSTTSTTSSTPLPSTTAAPSSTSSPPAPVPTPSLGASATSPSQSTSSGGISPAGVAVAVIFPIMILILVAWLIFRYNPRTRAWWLARQERLAKDRTYRDAIDGPNSSNTLRSQALGPEPTGRRSVLQSFFAPTTVKLGGGKEIRRKPVNWGADSTAPPTPRLDKEMASGMTNSSPATTLSSPVTEKPLPAARPKSHFDVIEMPANEITEKSSITSFAAPMGRRSSQNTVHSVRTFTSEFPAREPRAEPRSAAEERPVSPVSHLSRHQSVSAASAISPIQSPRVTGLGIGGQIPPMPQISRQGSSTVPRALDAKRLRAAQASSPPIGSNPSSANNSGETLAQPSPRLHVAQQAQAARPTMVKAAMRGSDGVYRLS